LQTEWNHGVGFEIELYLAPPLKGRPWWSLWTQVLERNPDYPSEHIYPGVPTGYLKAFKDDDVNTGGLKGSDAKYKDLPKYLF
jgi:hypothetical protein